MDPDEPFVFDASWAIGLTVAIKILSDVIAIFVYFFVCRPKWRKAAAAQKSAEVASMEQQLRSLDALQKSVSNTLKARPSRGEGASTSRATAAISGVRSSRGPNAPLRSRSARGGSALGRSTDVAGASTTGRSSGTAIKSATAVRNGTLVRNGTAVRNGTGMRSGTVARSEKGIRNRRTQAETKL